MFNWLGLRLSSGKVVYLQKRRHTSCFWYTYHMNKKRVQEGEEFGVITELYIVKASRWHPLLSGDTPYCQVTSLTVRWHPLLSGYILDCVLPGELWPRPGSGAVPDEQLPWGDPLPVREGSTVSCTCGGSLWATCMYHCNLVFWKTNPWSQVIPVRFWDSCIWKYVFSGK